MRRAALLLLLAFAAVSASARNLHGLTTSTTAGEGDSTPEAVPMETKGLFEDVLEYFETAGEVGAPAC